MGGEWPTGEQDSPGPRVRAHPVGSPRCSAPLSLGRLPTSHRTPASFARDTLLMSLCSPGRKRAARYCRAIQEVVRSYNGPLSAGQSLLRLHASHCPLETGKNVLPRAPRGLFPSEHRCSDTACVPAGARAQGCAQTKRFPRCWTCFRLCSELTLTVPLSDPALLRELTPTGSGTSEPGSLGPACWGTLWRACLGDVHSELDSAKRKSPRFREQWLAPEAYRHTAEGVPWTARTYEFSRSMNNLDLKPRRREWHFLTCSSSCCDEPEASPVGE